MSAAAARATSAPWWYRHRGAVIGAVYVAGFFVAAFFAPRVAGRPVTLLDLAYVRGGLAGAEGLLVAGAVGTTIAWALRVAGSCYLGTSVVMARTTHDDRLVVAGPFRYVRNPLYLGNVFLALGVATLATVPGAVVIVVGNVAIVVLLARYESRVLAARYGNVYAAYARLVPAFVPRPTPATVPGATSARPSLRAGIATEWFIAGFAVGAILLAAGAGPVAYAIAALVGIGMQIAVLARVKRVARTTGAD